MKQHTTDNCNDGIDMSRTVHYAAFISGKFEKKKITFLSKVSESFKFLANVIESLIKKFATKICVISKGVNGQKFEQFQNFECVRQFHNKNCIFFFFFIVWFTKLMWRCWVLYTVYNIVAQNKHLFDANFSFWWEI